MLAVRNVLEILAANLQISQLLSSQEVPMASPKARLSGRLLITVKPMDYFAAQGFSQTMSRRSGQHAL